MPTTPRVFPGWENEITFGGYLGRPPEIFTSPKTGTKIITLNIGRTVTNKTTQAKNTTWVTAKLFNSGEAMVLQKGDNVTVKGRLEQVNWTDKETGKERTKFEIIASSFTKHQKEEKQTTPPPPGGAPTVGGFSEFDDKDIPF